MRLDFTFDSLIESTILGLFEVKTAFWTSPHSFPGSSGGICEKSKLYSDGKRKSLNTGIITVQNYASHVPPKVSHITFAHEVGHNFGSPVCYSHMAHLTCGIRLSNLRFFFSTFTPSMTPEPSAPQENPKAKTRRRRAITSCMREPHRETSSTIISSPTAAFATSARFWRRREETVLLVGFTASHWPAFELLLLRNQKFKPCNCSYSAAPCSGEQSQSKVFIRK